MGEEKDQHEGPAKNKDNNGNKNKKKDKDSGNKKEEKPITVVLKVDLHCLGCTARVKKAILHFHGVDMVKEGEDNKLTVVGIGVDPVNLRDMVEKKMKKKVDLISPQPKKDKDGGGGNKKQDAGDGGGSSNNNNNRKKAEEKQNNDDDDKKKPCKEPPVTTAVLKVAYHCHGCGQKIHKTVSTYKGVHTVSIDKENDVVRVTGTMDAKALAECLKEKLRRPVEVVPEKKEKDKEKEKKKGGEEEERGNQGGKKKKEGGGGGGGGGGENGDNNYKLQGNKNELGGGGGGGASSKKIEYAMSGSGYMCWDESSGYVVDILHAPQWFSEENVNGCVVM